MTWQKDVRDLILAVGGGLAGAAKEQEQAQRLKKEKEVAQVEQNIDGLLGIALSDAKAVMQTAVPGMSDDKLSLFMKCLSKRAEENMMASHLLSEAKKIRAEKREKHSSTT